MIYYFIVSSGPSQGVTVDSFTTNSQLGIPSMKPGIINVGVSSIASNYSIDTPSLTMGTVRISPSSVSSITNVSDVVLTADSVSMVASDIPSPTNVGIPSLNTVTRLSVDTIQATSTVENPSLIITTTLLRVNETTSVFIPSEVSLSPGLLTMQVLETPSSITVNIPEILTSIRLGVDNPQTTSTVGIPSFAALPIYLTPTSIYAAINIGTGLVYGMGEKIFFADVRYATLHVSTTLYGE